MLKYILKKNYDGYRKIINYLMIGIINTTFGYFVGVFFYTILSGEYGLVFSATIANIVAITFSFCTYKIFVFRGSGNILKEYFKCYIVYGFSAIIGIILLLIFVKILSINIWISQLLVSCITVFFSYVGHSSFTFKVKS